MATQSRKQQLTELPLPGREADEPLIEPLIEHAADAAKVQSVVLSPAHHEAPSLARQLSRGEIFAAECPSRDVLKHITSRWGVLVLVALMAGTHRFSDLRRKIGGVSEKMLAQTLQWLESDGLVDRHAYPVVPPHVEYRLTELGKAAAERVEALADWIEGNLPRIMAHREARLEASAEAGSGVNSKANSETSAAGQA